MNYLTLKLKDKQLQPLESLTGEVAWQLDNTPKYMKLRLFWFTRGRGSDDLRVVEERELTAMKQGTIPFTFTLPAGPYSFSGRLITLTWAVEVVTDNKKVFSSKEFVLSPTGEEILLDATSA